MTTGSQTVTRWKQVVIPRHRTAFNARIPFMSQEAATAAVPRSEGGQWRQDRSIVLVKWSRLARDWRLNSVKPRVAGGPFANVLCSPGIASWSAKYVSIYP